MIPRIVLILSLVSRISTLTCQTGFILTSATACSNQYGPCATGNQNITGTGYANSCATCFNDAFLWQVSVSVTSCIPNACNSAASIGVTTACVSCRQGYALTVNRSCIINSDSTTASTNSTNSAVTNASDTSNIITASLILSATAIICVTACLIFKIVENCKIQDEDASSEKNIREKQNRRRRVRETSDQPVTNERQLKVEQQLSVEKQLIFSELEIIQ